MLTLSNGFLLFLVPFSFKPWLHLTWMAKYASPSLSSIVNKCSTSTGLLHSTVWWPLHQCTTCSSRWTSILVSCPRGLFVPSHLAGPEGREITISVLNKILWKLFDLARYTITLLLIKLWGDYRRCMRVKNWIFRIFIWMDSQWRILQ